MKSKNQKWKIRNGFSEILLSVSTEGYEGNSKQTKITLQEQTGGQPLEFSISPSNDEARTLVITGSSEFRSYLVALETAVKLLKGMSQFPESFLDTEDTLVTPCTAEECAKIELREASDAVIAVDEEIEKVHNEFQAKPDSVKEFHQKMKKLTAKRADLVTILKEKTLLLKELKKNMDLYDD